MQWVDCKLFFLQKSELIRLTSCMGRYFFFKFRYLITIFFLKRNEQPLHWEEIIPYFLKRNKQSMHWEEKKREMVIPEKKCIILKKKKFECVCWKELDNICTLSFWRYYFSFYFFVSVSFKIVTFHLLLDGWLTHQNTRYNAVSFTTTKASSLTHLPRGSYSGGFVPP